MAYQSYQIAAGWNNEAGFVNVEDITVSNARTLPLSGSPVLFVRGFDTFSRGQRRFDPAGGSSFTGFATVIWAVAVIDPLVRDHMIDTYAGQVTIATTVGVPGVYENWNAYLQVPDPVDISSQAGMLTEFELRFKLVSAT